MALLKNNWKIILSVVLGLLVLGAFVKKREDNYVNQIIELRKSQEEALKQIEIARKQEKKQLEINNEQYQKTISEISARYRKVHLELESYRKTREKEILKDRDPTVLAQKLSETMGLKVQP